MTDKLLNLEKKIQRLKEKRDKVHTQQALLFLKAVEKIFKDRFCPILVLDILAQTRATPSALHQQEEEKRAHSFRMPSSHSNGKNTSPINLTPHQG
jgi:hypothetical protein